VKTDLNLLRVLVAIYDTGSVSAAANRLSMSQPAASAALSRLRASLGDQLFVRRGARMEATPRAQRIIARTREVIQVIDHEILPNPEFSPARFTGELTLCMSEIGEAVFLPALYRRIRAEAPGARLRTIGLLPAELEGALYDGRVDSVLGYFPDLQSNFIFQQRLYSHDLTCLVRQEHPLAGPSMTLAEFLDMEHVLVRDDGRSQEMFEQELAARGIERKIALRTSHYMSLGTLINDSDLIVVLPRAVAELHVRSANARIIEPPFPIRRYDLKQYWHRRFHDDPKSIWLRTLIQEVLGQHAPAAP